MRIVIATPLYPPESGGPATYTKLLEEQLLEHDIAVTVVPFRDVAGYPPVIRHLLYGWRVFRAGADADLVYAQDPVSVGLPALWAAQLRGVPLALKVVGDWAWEQGWQRFGVRDSLETFVQSNAYSLPVRTLKWIEHYVARRAVRVVTPSKYLADIVQRWGVPRERITVVYNGVTIPEVAGRDVLRQMLGVEGTYAISIGRLVPWKGFRQLIDVTPGVREQVGQYRLVIAGDGPDRSQLERRIDQQGAGECVTLTGQLDRDTILRYLAAADVCVLNSGYEGFSHVLLEAMALGVPTVATDVGGNPELITHEKNGLLVPHGDAEALQAAIARAATDTKLRRKMTNEAVATAAQFKPKRTVRETAQVLRQAC